MKKVLRILDALFGIKNKLYDQIDELDKKDDEINEYIDEIIEIMDKAQDTAEAAKGIVNLIKVKLKRIVDKIF